MAITDYISATTLQAEGWVNVADAEQMFEKLDKSYLAARGYTDASRLAGIRRSTNALVAWFLSENYSIELKELARRIGAAVLLALFTLTFNNDDQQIARRTRTRSRRRNEYEYYEGAF